MKKDMKQEIIKEIRRVYKEQGRIALSLFALFNFFLLEVKEKSQCQKNQRLTKISAKKEKYGKFVLSISLPNLT
ncbi:MAG: hypothetical protein ACE5HR_04915, partial [bacterium]